MLTGNLAEKAVGECPARHKNTCSARSYCACLNASAGVQQLTTVKARTGRENSGVGFLHLVDNLSVSPTRRQNFGRAPINLLLRNDCAAFRFMSDLQGLAKHRQGGLSPTVQAITEIEATSVVRSGSTASVNLLTIILAKRDLGKGLDLKRVCHDPDGLACAAVVRSGHCCGQWWW